MTDSATPRNPYAPTAIPRAPEGTSWNTPWIWLVVVVPLVPIVPLLFIDWGALFGIALIDSTPTLSAVFPASFWGPYLLSLALGMIGYALAVVFAYLDFRELTRRAVPRPFHWAWTFLYPIVYTVGRSIVVARRTGRGHAPIWAEGGAFLLAIGVAVVMMVQIFAATYSFVGSVSGS